MATVLPRVIPEERQVGQVYTTITVANNVDMVDAERGLLPRADVRSLTLTRVLVDTGATLLGLPEDVTRKLGLRVTRETRIRTAAGRTTANVYGNVWLECQGRFGVFDCIELPEGTPVLLGVVPLESLGLQPDVHRHVLIVLSDSDDDTYITAF